jgi:curved DNA-binding protein CbpA
MFRVSVADCNIVSFAKDELPSSFRSQAVDTHSIAQTESDCSTLSSQQEQKQSIFTVSDSPRSLQQYTFRISTKGSAFDPTFVNSEATESAHEKDTLICLPISRTISMNDHTHKIQVGRPIIDPYQVLQIRRDATPSEIRHSYKRLALWHHPQRKVSDVSLEEGRRRNQLFKVLAACYETLMDKEAKARLDSTLKEMETQQQKQTIDPLKEGSLAQAPDDEQSPRIASSRSSDSLKSLEKSISQTGSWSSPGGSMRYRRRKESQEKKNGKVDGSPGRRLFWGRSNAIPESDAHRGRWTASQGEDNTDNHRPVRNHTFPDVILSSSSSESSIDAEKHYTEHETNRLFGGPLQLLFRSRRWKPFSDPYEVFAEVFQSHAWHHPATDSSAVNEWASENPQCAKTATTLIGSTERQPDGSIVFVTKRVLHDRILVRTETVRADTVTGKRHSRVQVTSEPINEEIEIEARQSNRSICGMDSIICIRQGLSKQKNHAHGVQGDALLPQWSLCGLLAC